MNLNGFIVPPTFSTCRVFVFSLNTPTHTQSLSLSLSHTHTHAHWHTHAHTFSLYKTQSLALTHTDRQTHTLSLSLFLTHTPTRLLPFDLLLMGKNLRKFLYSKKYFKYQNFATFVRRKSRGGGLEIGWMNRISLSKSHLLTQRNKISKKVKFFDQFSMIRY